MDFPDYPLLRSSAHPRWERLPPERFERVVASELWAEAEDVESFLSGLQDFGRNAGAVFQRAMPGVVQGASTGAAFGPWGALIGALGGGAASALSGPAAAPPRGPAPPAVPAVPVAAAPAPPPAVAPVAPAPPPVAPAPAASLLGLLGRPEVVQALGALALGPNGRPSVQVGSTPVPVAAVANMLSSLAAQSAAAAPVVARPGEDVEELPAYLRRDDGSLRVLDPSSSQDRAEALLELFESTPSPYSWGEDQEDQEDVEEYEAADEGAELYEGVLDEGGSW
jgi:hypothetical protein